MGLKRTPNRTYPGVRDFPANPGIPGFRRKADRNHPAFRTLPGPWDSITLGGVFATLTTALAGSNNDLTYTAKQAGADGNNTTVRYVVAGASTPLSVSVSGTAITVNVATNGSSAATSTAAQVKAAVDASTAAAALVTTANATGNDGTGVVTALSATPLATGSDTETFGT